MSILSSEVKKEIQSLIEQETLPHLQRIVKNVMGEHLKHHEEEKAWTHRSDNAYKSWSANEDRELWREWEEFLEETASCHRRGVGAIRCRIKKMIGMNPHS